jgi:uncharacterized protein (TIGR02217 family)
MSIVIDNVYLPVEVERGALGGPMFKTTVLTLQNGKEDTIEGWSLVRHKWTVSINFMSVADYTAVKAFFLARRAKARGFRFKDWTDYLMPRQTIATGDGVTTVFALGNTYDDDAQPYTRIITHPVASTLKVYKTGVLQAISFLNGSITFGVAPALGAVIEAECDFDNAVRFDTDFLPMRVAWAGAAAVENFDIVEVNKYGDAA